MDIKKRRLLLVVLSVMFYAVCWMNVLSYDINDLKAANTIAEKGYINQHSTVQGYDLDFTITRAEIAKVATKVAWIDTVDKCADSFEDVSATNPNNWVCSYVEALLNEGYISKNKNYNPNSNLTKAEAVKLMLTVAGENIPYSENSWQEDFVWYAIEKGFVARFSDYDTPATRAFTFLITYTATLEEESYNDDILVELDDLLGWSTNESIWFTVWWWFWADYIRETIKNDILPKEEDIKYNNFLKDYSFDKIEWECREKFCPIFNWVNLKNPITQTNENWLEMYLWSNIKEDDYIRKPTNFVIVMDISGSMDSTLSSSSNSDDLFDKEIKCDNAYLYFKPLNNCVLEIESETYIDNFKEYSQQTKLELSKNITQNLIWKLQTNDRIWIVTFSNEAIINHELVQLDKLDSEVLIDHIEKIRTDWSTNMKDGFEKWINIFSEDILSDSSYQNRVIFITDAMPNTWWVSEDEFKTLLTQASEESIYFSFIWVWLDFKQSLIDTISQTKWWNYFFVNSGYDFYREVIQDFDYSFFPMFFNISLKEISDKKIISNVYGLDSDILKWELIKINTLFPSRPQLDGSTKGSVVLFKLEEIIDKSITLSMEYEDLTWTITKNNFEITKDLFEVASEIWNYEDSKSNIYKAVLIIEYVKELKESLMNENAGKLEEIIFLLNENKDLFWEINEEQLEEEIVFIKQVITLLWTTKDYWTD